MSVEIPKFLKWAGGKTQLVNQYKPLFPKKFNRYIEPFLGSGAIFFHIIQNYEPSEIILSDINEELIDTYNIIKDDVERLIVELKQHKEYHTNEGKKYYLTIRGVDSKKLPKLERAARFIYLNKTCFNGLYRVNSKGKFNVPMGSYKNPDIIQEEKLRKVSELLQNVKIKSMSFEKVVSLAKKEDFVYLDPPYYPLKKGQSFTTYSKDNFLEEEQRNLLDAYNKLHKKGCYIMESNSDTDFIKELYSNYNIHYVQATRMINSNSEKRGKINEVVITNY